MPLDKKASKTQIHHRASAGRIRRFSCHAMWMVPKSPQALAMACRFPVRTLVKVDFTWPSLAEL
jgi:hypothetical protein